VKGHLNTEPYQQQFVGHLVSLLQNEEWRSEWGAKGMAHTLTLAWQGVADDWLAEWEEASKGKQVALKSGSKFLKETR